MGLLELGRWNVAECAVEALFVEPVHPLKGCQLDLVDVAPWSLPADQFGLVETGAGKVRYGWRQGFGEDFGEVGNLTYRVAIMRTTIDSVTRRGSSSGQARSWLNL